MVDLARTDLVISGGWRGLYVNDDRVFNIDQVIEPIAECVETNAIYAIAHKPF